MNKKIFAPHALAALILLSAGSSWADEATSPATTSFDIPPQNLEAALIRFSEQSDIQLVMASADVDGKEVEGVVGDLTHQEALVELLDNTGLEYRFVNDETVAIGVSDKGGDSDSKNLNPTPVLMAQNQASETRAGVSKKASDALEAPESRNGKAAKALEEIIVTGTNIRGVENPTVPVLTFDKEDIDLSGASTMDDFLRTIPQNFASETQLSANSGNPNGSDRNQTQGTVVDLRGLGPGSTLTLLNGRRMTASGQTSAVDINVLPLGVIERVDVLTDGATAVYGSDAVGGVVNFITRKDYEGFDINARYGTVTEGSREDFGVGGAGGGSWGSGSVFAGVDYQEQKPLLVEERDFVDLLVTNEGATLGADLERFSVAGGINQSFGAKTRLGIDVLFSNVKSESLSAEPLNARIRNSDQNAFFINSRLEYDVTERITAAVFIDHGRNEIDFTDTLLTFDAINSFDFDNELNVYEGQLSGQVLDLPGGVVSFSVGGLYREETFLDVFSSNFSPDRDVRVSADRGVSAAYAEVLVPVIGEANALPLVQRLEFSLAGRYEDYSDFGDTLDPKIGVYWEVNDDLSFRASYSESFRAPDLQSVNAVQNFVISVFSPVFFSAFTEEELPEPDPTVGGFPGLFEIGGNPDLVAETATTWSAGFAYEPNFMQGLKVEGNYFTISYLNRLEQIRFLDPFQDPAFRELIDIPADLAEIEAIFARAAAGEIQLTNGGSFSADEVTVRIANLRQNISERDVSGFDLNLNYTKETDIGRFSAGANASYLIDYVARPTPSAETTEQVNILYRPIDFKLRGSVSWSHKGLTAFTAVNYTDGYRDNPNADIANSIASWVTVDMSLAYHTDDRFNNWYADGMRIGFSVTNLFDNDPPFVATPWGLNFDSANANPFGRQVNFTISKTF